MARLKLYLVVKFRLYLMENLVVNGLRFRFNGSTCITNFISHNLVIIVVQNMFFIGSYGINTNVIHLFVLFKHWCCAHCLDMSVICMFISFKHGCTMFICGVYTWKLCTQLLCLNNVRHSCLNNTNLWNHKFHTYLKWTHKAYNFLMLS